MSVRVHPLQVDHWPQVLAVQDTAYAELGLEPADVMRSKWQVSPDTCFVAQKADELLGYILTHPWPLPDIPPPLYQPTRIEQTGGSTLFIHDLAVAPRARGYGVAHALFSQIYQVAHDNNMHCLMLVAVQGASGFWLRQGFTCCPHHAGALDSYGEGACLMKKYVKQTRSGP